MEGAAETARVAALAATASRRAQEMAQRACARSSGKIDTLQDLLSLMLTQDEIKALPRSQNFGARKAVTGKQATNAGRFFKAIMEKV